VGLCLARSGYSVDTASAALERLIRDGSFAGRAKEIAAQIQSENALQLACDAIDAVL